jgi:hypothetical protein
VAWPEPSAPLEIDGESADGEEDGEEDEPDDEDDEDEPVDDDSVVGELEFDAACAATAAATVPARLAATSPTVIAVVRRRPVSRSITGPPLR